MADDAELIGGISVSVGASHSKLISDLAEADNIIESWAKKPRNATVGAQFAGSPGGAGAGSGGAAASEMSALVRAMSSLETALARGITVAPSAVGGAAARYVRPERSAAEEQEASIRQYPAHMQTQMRAQLASQGSSAVLPGETAPMQSFRVDTKTAHSEIEAISTDIEEAHAEAAKPSVLAIDTKALQNDLQAILALLKEVVGTAVEAKQATAAVATPPAATPARRPAAPRARTAAVAGEEDDEGEVGVPKQGPRRKNIRDQGIGTEAQSNRVYTFDPEVYAEQEARQEAGAARARELAFTQHQQRAQVTEAAQQRQAEQAALRADAQTRQRAARASSVNAQQAERAQREAFLNSPPPPGAGAPPAGSATIAPLSTPESRSADAARRGGPRTANGDPLVGQPFFNPGPGYANAGPPLPGVAGAPRLTDVEMEARRRRDREFADRANAPRQHVDQESTPTAAERENIAQGRRAETRRQSFEERQQRALNTRQFQEAEIVRRQEQAQATAQAQITAAGRTARTTASGFGAFFGGPRREQIEAQTALSAAVKETASASRYASVFENEMIRNEVKATGSTVGEAKALRDRNKEIKGSDQYKQAVQARTEAIEKEGAATERVAKLSQGFGTAARSLAAVTVAGSAFGIGLQAISVAFDTVQRVASPYIDSLTGYASKTNDLTSALADQARQQQGNAAGVVALKLAQSGFAASSAAAIQPIIAQRVQVEAGNKALQDQIDTFRVSENLRKQAGTAGLGGGTGGVLGTSLFGIPGTGEQTGNFLQGLQNKVVAQQGLLAKPPSTDDITSFFPGIFGPRTLDNVGKAQNPAELKSAQDAFNRGLGLVNGQLRQGGDAAAQFQHALVGADARIEQTAKAFEPISREMADAIRAARLYSTEIAGSVDPTNSAAQALRAINRAGTLTGPGEQLAAEQLRQTNSRNSIQALQSQQAFERPGFIAGVIRQQGLSANVQLPAQEALANLAAPPTPVGTGRVAANAREQRQINAETKQTQALQDGLNENYAKGLQILQDTYKPAIIQNFGIAAGATFASLIDQITSTGQAIAKVQAGISNEQAAYQTAQYNYQLFIAKRTLSDIGGLTDHNFGAGKSYLGVLEGQNLALSRQAQLLQFGLSQRQINLQRAVAGFTVPGLTPAEQNARVREAKIEADFAQKQLDIQRKMFGNQVKIVDISNLRQGADLVKQIALLQQGRQVTIDTQAAQEKLERLNKRQQHLIAQAGTYITAIDQIVAKAQSDMAAQEAILGRSLGRFETQAVASLYHVGRAFFLGITGAVQETANQFQTSSNVDRRDRARHAPTSATGNIFSTTGTTSLGPYGIAGEAGRETVAILRNPHALSGGLGGGGNATVNFNGDMVFKTEADFQRLYRMVLSALGRDAATKGLRTPF